MGFIVWFPNSQKSPITLSTTNQLIPQLWQEFVMLRYLSKQKHISSVKVISPWIDQAKTYFLDASQDDWHSAGLLYYYSFLNLAKALLVAKRQFSYKKLNATSIYHGLQSELQNVSSIINYKFKIFPPKQRNKDNIFSNLYKTITGEKWPFKTEIEISVGDISGYCGNISAELEKLFNITNHLISIQSLIRVHNKQAWFEMCVPVSKANVIISSLPSLNLEQITISQMTEIDKK